VPAVEYTNASFKVITHSRTGDRNWSASRSQGTMMRFIEPLSATITKSQRMLLNSSDLQSYLRYVFNRFRNVSGEWFDFIQAPFAYGFIPLDFCGTTTRLALNVTYTNQ
jgi:hypothetical protein